MKDKKHRLKFKNFALCSAVLLFTLYSLLLNKVLAQAFSLSISPPLLETQIQPGKSFTQVYRLTNQGPNANIQTSIVPFEPSDELGNIELKLNNSLSAINNQQFLSFFSFQNQDIKLPGIFFLKSGETQELILKIDVPKNAEEKDYYASLLFQVNPVSGLISATGSQISSGISSNILLTVSKDNKIPTSGKVSDFSSKQFTINNLQLTINDSFDTIPFSLKIANNSKRRFKASGFIRIINPWGKEETILEIQPQNILANSSRKILLKDNQELAWQPNIFNIGSYQAQAVLYLNNSQNKLEKNINFFVFPWKISLALISFIILYSLLKHVKTGSLHPK